MQFANEVIFCVVNAGFSEQAMAAARECGAKGGTVLRARGTANPNAEKLFQIEIQPEKEIVMIICKSEIKDDIMHGLYRAVGLTSPANGIVFALPVEKTVGLGEKKPPETKS